MSQACNYPDRKLNISCLINGVGIKGESNESEISQNELDNEDYHENIDTEENDGLFGSDDAENEGVDRSKTYTTSEQRKKQAKGSRGTWTGKVGDSKFIPDNDDAIEALKTFTQNNKQIEVSKDNVIKYVLNDEFGDVNEIDDIYIYVNPKTIFIPRNEDNLLAILCDYKFDEEHGIAIVFDNGKYKEVVPQDDVI